MGGSEKVLARERQLNSTSFGTSNEAPEAYNEAGFLVLCTDTSVNNFPGFSVTKFSTFLSCVDFFLPALIVYVINSLLYSIRLLGISMNSIVGEMYSAAVI